MAGHSKWANIKHQKARNDAKKGKIFTKLIRDIMTAAKMGGGDPAANSSLRLVLEKARQANMGKDVIDRAIKRGTGEIQGEDYSERTYEGYAPGGVALMITTLTDNPTRTITNIRTIFNKNGGNSGNDGTVAWMFKQQGEIAYPASVGDEDTIMEAAIEAGAADFSAEDDYYYIYTDVADFGTVRDALEDQFGAAEEADLVYTPTQPQPITDVETAQSVMKIIAKFEDDDDVQNVFHNMDISDDIAAQLEV